MQCSTICEKWVQEWNSKKEKHDAEVLSLLSPLLCVCVFWGLSYTRTVPASIVIGTVVLFTVLQAHNNRHWQHA